MIEGVGEMPDDESQRALADATPPMPRAGVADYGFHGALFLGSFVVLILAALFRVDGPEQVFVPFMDRPLPPMCTMKALTGLDCPGCGLTRSFVSLAHGRLGGALAFNIAGPLLFSLMAFQVFYRPVQWWRLYHRRREYDLTTLGAWGLSAVAVLLVAQWGIKVFLAARG